VCSHTRPSPFLGARHKPRPNRIQTEDWLMRLYKRLKTLSFTVN